MSSAFAAPAAAPKTLAPDPSKHVNFTLGMLLGVDDFNQEFAYLAGRDRWLARDLLGCGTIDGLRVTVDPLPAVPRITVTSGSALSRGGQLICVRPAQCANLNDWLAANPDLVANLATAAGASPIRLFLVLCYRSCPVDNIPIPGEPCRDDGDLTAPSRLKDDFKLDLRASPPNQAEEDAIRDFVQWLEQIQITDDPGLFLSAADFEKAVRAAIPSGSDLAAHGLHMTVASPLATVHVHPADAREFLRIALRVWVTDIRPLVDSACVPAAECGCGDAPATTSLSSDDALLLAEIDVPLVKVGSTWKASDTLPVTSDESRRPFLIHLRLLQELFNNVISQSISSVGVAAGAVPAEIVAAGVVSATAPRSPVLGGLSVTAPSAGRLIVRFTAYSQPADAFQFIVKATPFSPAPAPAVSVDSFAADGIQLNVARGATAVPAPELSGMQFMIEVTRIG